MLQENQLRYRGMASSVADRVAALMVTGGQKLLFCIGSFAAEMGLVARQSAAVYRRMFCSDTSFVCQVKGENLGTFCFGEMV